MLTSYDVNMCAILYFLNIGQVNGQDENINFRNCIQVTINAYSQNLTGRGDLFKLTITFSTFISEIHYHQSFMKGHVCLTGKNTNLNMQMHAIEQRYVMSPVFYVSTINRSGHHRSSYKVKVVHMATQSPSCGRVFGGRQATVIPMWRSVA